MFLALNLFYNTVFTHSCEFMSYAIIKSGAHQFRVQKGLVLDVEKLEGNPGDQIKIQDVCQLSHDGQCHIGQPTVVGATVVCELVKHKRAPKVMVMKLRRRKNSRRRNGHRQHLTVLKVLEISYQPNSTEAPDGN